MKVGLVVDNPRRDLIGLTLLGSELINQGHDVLIIPMNLAFYEIPFHQPDYLLLPGFRKTSLPIYTERFNLGINLGIMETEGAFYLESSHRMQILEDSPKVNDIISHYFVWGQSYKNILLETKTIDKQKIFVTGNPKIDITQKLPLQSNIKDSVLFCSNFTMVSGNELNTSMVDSFEAKGIKNALSFYSGLENMKKEFIELANLLDKKGVNVIFRPHPFEDLDFYKNAFIDSNINIDVASSPIESIDKSFITIQNSSTTGVEAILRNVPTVIPDYIANGYKIETIRGVSYLAKSRDEVLDFIKQAQDKKLDSKKESDALNDVVFLKNDMNSAHLIAKEISKTAPREKSKKPDVSLRYALKKQLKAIVKLPLERNSFKKYVLSNRMKDWDNSYKFFNKQSVEDQLSQLNIESSVVSEVPKSRSILMTKK